MKKIIRKILKHYFKKEIEIMLNENWKDVNKELPINGSTCLVKTKHDEIYIGNFDYSQGWYIKGSTLHIVSKWRYIQLELS